MKVLVVDDVDLNQRLLSAAIRDLCDDGVFLAERATKGIELAISESPDLIFMDIGLPDLDGLEAIELMKSNPRLSQIPIIVVSAHALPEYVERAKLLGCEGYITKPITIAAVRETVRRYKSERTKAEFIRVDFKSAEISLGASVQKPRCDQPITEPRLQQRL